MSQELRNEFSESKEKFLKFVDYQNPKATLWISKLLDEIEAKTEQLEIKWSPPLPKRDYPVSAQIFVRKWNLNPMEILADDFFVYFVEPQFYFDGWGQAGEKPLWEFPNALQSELSKVLRNKAAGGGITLNLKSKIKFNRIIKAIDLIIKFSDTKEIISNKKVEQRHAIKHSIGSYE